MQPNIAFAVGQLTQFMKNFGRIHWEVVKCILRYLKGTRDWKLVYGRAKGCGLEGFMDADGAMQEHRRAISGYVILIDRRAISWCLKKQELVTLSTAEAEYIAAMHTAKELVWFRRLLGEIFQPLLLWATSVINTPTAMCGRVDSLRQGLMLCWV